MVRFVVEDHDILHPHQVRHDALDHLAFGFLRVERVTCPALQELTAALGKLDALAQLEGVVVRDDDLGPFDILEHVGGHKLAVDVIAVRVGGLEHAQAVFDR